MSLAHHLSASSPTHFGDTSHGNAPEPHEPTIERLARKADLLISMSSGMVSLATTMCGAKPDENSAMPARAGVLGLIEDKLDLAIKQMEDAADIWRHHA